MVDTAGWELAALVLRWLHIAAAAVALFTLAVPLLVRKGNALHRRFGRIYVWAMVVAAATALAITPIRLVQRPSSQWNGPLFLAYVALLSFCAAFYGWRVLGQKQRSAPLGFGVDLAVPIGLLLGTVMIFAYAVQARFVLGMVFAPLGVATAVPQLRVLTRAPEGKTWWLVEHLRAMMISTIATITAFAVVNANRVLEGNQLLFAWLGPTVLLVPLMTYWAKRYGAGRGRLDASVKL